MSSPLRTSPIASSDLRRFAAGGYLYAILDAYEASGVTAKVQELGRERAVSLFGGDSEKRYWDLAPYLILVEEATLDWILQNLEGLPWGVFVLSKSGLESLCTHFRRFLIVQLPDGERWFFRYYDPRLLSIYLSKCLPDELTIFLGPVRSFAIRDTASGNISLFYAAEEPSGEVPAPGSVWQVRVEQFEALEEASHHDLEDRLFIQLKAAVPQHCQTLGEEGTRKFIRYGVLRAASHLIHLETEITTYLGLMFAFGPDFDRDPALSWASAILNDSAFPNSSTRMQRLREAGEKATDRVRATRTGA